MVSSKGISRDRAEKKRMTEGISRSGIRSNVRSTRRKCAKTPRCQRQPYESVSIPQLVYKLLTIDKYNQETKRYPSPEVPSRASRRRTQKYHELQRYPYKMVDRRDSPESIQVSEYAMGSGPTSVESLTEAMDAANSSAPISSTNSSVSNISMEPITLANSLNSARALLKKKSLVQLINNYIKAGIEEGKRQAKKYIRKALSFGVRSGYLIPADRQGSVLRVCPTLDVQSWSSRRDDAESRRRRRIARRGETHLTTVDDRKAMRRGIQPGKSRRDMNNTQVTSRRRHRMRLSQSPARSPNTRQSDPRKSPDESTLRERNKPKTVAKRKSKTIDGKRRQQRKKGDVKKSVKRRRTTSSPKPFSVENDHEPIEENCNDVNDRYHDQHKGNEDNYKVASTRDDSSKMEKRRAGTSIDKGCDGVECRNAQDDDNNVDDERSEKASSEHVAIDAIKEMDT